MLKPIPNKPGEFIDTETGKTVVVIPTVERNFGDLSKISEEELRNTAVPEHRRDDT